MNRLSRIPIFVVVILAAAVLVPAAEAEGPCAQVAERPFDLAVILEAPAVPVEPITSLVDVDPLADVLPMAGCPWINCVEERRKCAELCSGCGDPILKCNSATCTLFCDCDC